MATQSLHQVKARNNRDFLSEIDATVRGDWAVVVAFDTADHLVERLRAQAACTNSGHAFPSTEPS